VCSSGMCWGLLGLGGKRLIAFPSGFLFYFLDAGGWGLLFAELLCKFM